MGELHRCRRERLARRLDVGHHAGERAKRDHAEREHVVARVERDADVGVERQCAIPADDGVAGCAVRGLDDVVRGELAVNNTAAVRVSEQVRDFTQHADDVGDRHRRAALELADRGAVDPFERGPGTLVGQHAALEYARDTGMRERLEQTRLAQHRHRDRARPRTRVHDLHQHAPRQQDVLGLVDGAGLLDEDLCHDGVVADSARRWDTVSSRKFRGGTRTGHVYEGCTHRALARAPDVLDLARRDHSKLWVARHNTSETRNNRPQGRCTSIASRVETEALR